MGKEIAPREELHTPAKRDIAGFDRALRFAEAALTKGPTVQLGTGAEGSGVGIIVDNRPAGVAGVAPQGVAPAAEKRDLEASQKQPRAKVTTLYIRSGVPAGRSPCMSQSLGVYHQGLAPGKPYKRLTRHIRTTDLQ
jgi:hypothetical protein